jgi:hypothetical protein
VGQRVDIFLIRDLILSVQFAKWAAPFPRSVITELLAGEQHEPAKAPMANCFCELTLIVDFDRRKVLWAANDLDQDPAMVSEIVPDRIGDFEIVNVGCYCAIYTHLKLRGLWSWPKPNANACRLLQDESEDP